MRKKFSLILIVFILIGFAAFANGLRNPMMLDDYMFFNEKMRNINYAWMQFVPDKDIFLGIKNQEIDEYYRPMAHIIPMLAYWLFHENVVGHHAFNLCLLIGASFFLAYFIWRFFGDWRVGFLAGVGYLVHPINGITVNYITASVFSSQVIFTLASLTCLAAQNAHNKFRNIGLSILFYILAIFCHETGMAVPFYATVLIFVLSAEKNMLVGIRNAVTKTLPLWFVLAAYFLFRMKYSSLNENILNNFDQFHMNAWEYVASMTRLVGWYFVKLLYPVGIVIIKPISVQRENLPFWILLAGVFLAIFIAGLKRYRNAPCAVLGILWFMIGFIPFTQACLFLPIHGPVLEAHWFIFPVTGFFIFTAFVVVQLWDRTKHRLLPWAAGLVLMSWLIATWGMNAIWGNEISYYYYWLRQAPGYSAVMFYLGQAYEMRRQHGPARYWYEQAAAENYKLDMTYSNLALVDIMEKRWDLAQEHFKKALAINPNIVSAYSNLGNIAQLKNDNKLAEDYFRRAIEIDPYSMLPRINLAGLYLKIGDIAAARKAYEEVLEIGPENETALTNLLFIYWKAQDKGNVLRIAKRFIAVSNDAKQLANAAAMVGSLGNRNLARTACQKALTIEPGYLRAQQLLELTK